ncbi:TnsA endonuclease N-terminal domain-containing protein [Streptomyces sp. NRRL S-378]|uniref:TnsA endonuclease N-terminal domain-containing protein n=1 Tax=Streptomyces sp. NRRL S-378 TaxID=1463904 RepID=UPI0004C4EAF6|nr:TnsA endonuclease N-terminal domain-containing protein [Streptomyces sp. NRRL S-378]
MVPEPAADEPLGWLRARLAADPAYSWQSMLDARRLHERRERQERNDRDPTPAQQRRTAEADEVLADWEQATGHVLRPERREVFLARTVVHDLAAVTSEVRRAAARRLWQAGTRLLLDDWLLECVCPGAVGLTPAWNRIAERDPDTLLVLRELLAAAVGEIVKERDREVLSRRLGLYDQSAHTLEKIAEAFGISRERVRQLQTRAIRSMRRTTGGPASRKVHAVLAELSCVDRVPPGAEPPTAERLLDLADALLPSMAPRQAVPLLARLAGADRVRAENLAAEAATVRMLRHDAARRETARQVRVDRAARRWEALSADVNWFGKAEPAPAREELDVLREKGGRGVFGMWHCPKLGREVAYESDTELRVIQLLSFAPQVAYYQEQPLAISYWFAGRQRTYYPDLLMATVDGQCILIEVKPVYEMAMAVNVAKYRAVEAFCRNRGWGLIATDGNRTLSLLENRSVDPRVDTALTAALETHGELTWPQVRAALGDLEVDSLTMSALILKRSWSWSIRPYRLRMREPAAPHAPLEPDGPGSRSVLLDSLPDVAATSAASIAIPSPDEIEAMRTPAGGWTRDQLSAWGIPWPPPKGWRKQLVSQWRAEQQRPPG